MVRAINDNAKTCLRPRGEFTAIQATEMLPLVRHIVGDLVQLHESIKAQREQLRGVDALAQTMDVPNYREELSDVRGTLAEDERRWEACLAELAYLGVEVHEPFDGFVDFPAVINRRQVRLCWQIADKSVEYWHEPGQSTSQRQKLRSHPTR